MFAKWLGAGVKGIGERATGLAHTVFANWLGAGVKGIGEHRMSRGYNP